MTELTSVDHTGLLQIIISRQFTNKKKKSFVAGLVLFSVSLGMKITVQLTSRFWGLKIHMDPMLEGV